MLFGVLQGTGLEPLLFNILSFDMFHLIEDFDIATYVNGSTPCCAGKSAEFVVNNLERHRQFSLMAEQ